jgi:hypothetical protein
VRLKRDEQVGLLTCSEGHHSLLLDSRDYWADILQNGKPKQLRCKCGSKLFAITLIYEFRDTGDIRSVDVFSTCHACAHGQSRALFEINYSPTKELVTRPLDPIQKPWMQPKRREITAYWKPKDAESFVRHLVLSLGANIIQHIPRLEMAACKIEDIDFYPELKSTLYFTNIHGLDMPKGPHPENSAPCIRLWGPLHMMLKLDREPGYLYYVDYSLEVVRGADIVKQPAEFLAFAHSAVEWLSHEFPSTGRKYSADNPEEYMRLFGDRGPKRY